MTRRNWILITGAGALFALVAVWWAYRYGTQYCTAMKAANLMRDAKDRIAPIDCNEFWLNRYQTSLQTLISSVIGGLGLYFIIRQLKALAQQNEMTRAALDANTRAQEAAERGLRGKARSAVGAVSVATARLLLEAAVAMESTKSRKFEMNPAPFEKATAAIPDIDPALDTDDIRQDWKILLAEYGYLQRYISSKREGWEDDRIKMTFLDPKCMPTDFADARKRAFKLVKDLHDFSDRLDR